MPYVTRFTEPVKKRILEALKVGASRETAAHIAGIGTTTFETWVREGKDNPDSPKGRFLAEMLQAEAHPRDRALGIIYREMENNPTLAWKFIERREAGFAPPMPQAPATTGGPVVIQLALHDGSRPALEAVPEVIEGEVVAEDATTEAG